MDIVKKKPQTKLLKNKLVLIPATLTVLLLLGWGLGYRGDSQKISRSTILLGKVKRGNLDVLVEGYGVLRSDHLKLLATSTGGSVEQIFLKPGAVVTTDSVVMQLRNPALEHKVAEELQKLAQEKMSLRQLELSLKVDMLAEYAKKEEEQTKYLSAKATREEQEPWATQGVVTKLSFRETQLKESLLAKGVETSNSRIRQLELVHQELKKIQQEKITAQQGAYQAAKDQFDLLTVRAGMTGVVQSVAVEVGQNIPPSQQLALIGGTDQLLALIKVPQSAAARIKAGQTTVVDTHQDKINGQVTRVDPAVRDGTIQVEIALKDKLPNSARPELNVDATILVDQLKNVMYVERPANARPNSTANMFRVQGSKATLAPIDFGAEAGKYIQVLGRTGVDDTLILSDMSKYQKSPAMAIVD